MASINQFITSVSSPRGVMLNSHFNSHLALLNPDSRLIKSGTEFELAKYINDVKTEQNCIVKAIIPRYGNTGITQIPEYVLLVEYEENNQIFIDFISVPMFNSTHNYFGYTLTPTEEFNNLYIGAEISKETLLARTASYKDDKSYGYGVNANVALMTHPAVSEDGYVVSESFCQKLKTHSILKRTLNISKDYIPINLYGDSKNYKFVPDIGEQVRPDGLLCCMRQKNEWFSMTDLSDRSLCEPDLIFDIPIYVNTNSRVIDIKVTRNAFYKSDYSSKLTEQLDWYSSILVLFYKNIVQQYEYIMQEKKKIFSDVSHIRVTPRLQRLLVDSKFKIDAELNNKIKLCYRKMPIEQYRIDIYTISELTPGLGYKLTDIHAAKGVITKVLPDAEMPRDKNGVVADIISDPMSTTSRMNLGRVHEGYLGAAIRDTRNKFINYIESKYNCPIETAVHQMTMDDVMYIAIKLHKFYALINPKMVYFLDTLNDDERANHVKEVLLDNLYIYFSVDNEKKVVDVILDIEKSEFRPLNDIVTYVNDRKEHISTQEPIRICNMYYMLLEKIGNTYMAVSSAKINNFGFPIKGTTVEKYKTQHALTPTKTLGETEVRILTSYMEQKGIAEMLDLTLNPVGHKLAIKHLLTKDQPSKVEHIIDRSIYSYGQNKSLLLFKHILNSAGVDITHVGD